MDGTMLNILISIATIEAISILLVNSFLLYLLAYKTPSTLKHISEVHFMISLLMTIMSMIAYTTLNRMVTLTPELTSVFSIIGLCQLAGEQFCYHLDALVIPGADLLMFVIPFSILYKIIMFKTKPWSRISLLMYLIGTSTPWIAVSAFLQTRYVPSTNLNLTTELKAELNGSTIYGVNFNHPVLEIYRWIGQYDPIVACLITIVLRWYFLRILRKSANTLSNYVQDQYNRFSKVMLIQSLLPALGFVVVFLLGVVEFVPESHPIFGCLSFIILSPSALIFALAILFFTKHYRKEVEQIFCRKKVTVVTIKPPTVATE